MIPNTPWCFTGEYNAIIRADEYKENHCPAKTHMTSLTGQTLTTIFISQQLVTNTLGVKCRYLTEKRLDRAVYRVDWLDSCPIVILTILV